MQHQPAEECHENWKYTDHSTMFKYVQCKQTNKQANKQEMNNLYNHTQQIFVQNILLDVNIVNF